ncbi:PREDICTED: tRNA modification GTPase MnmE-like [Trachymyrmex cornetzi]|uniref:tRNA modification GTPase MnmE-like n=1 Tax=Trachymyrmex cornetzi TaxID=471704 RepID=UPI00084EE92E|nr:PREDICTED: tRNA modification GTPase MnmE-like [Trachymyrmex cornetzi]
MSNTIFALSTIFGKSGVAVIRISGPDAKLTYSKLGGKEELINRRAMLSRLFSQAGEDVLELHVYGSIAVINDLMQELHKLDFLRLAEPEEFIKRAFYNSKFDLTKAEALADLLDAQTELQKSVAIRNLSGELENLYDSLRSSLIDIVTDSVRRPLDRELEALCGAQIGNILVTLEELIDFPEDDIPDKLLDNVNSEISRLRSEITRYIKINQNNTSLNDGVRVTIIGPPNAGKSTLLNIFSQRNAAIVSDIAGTTRDIIESKVDIGGFPVVFADMAGVRETVDPVEQEGIKRAKKSLLNSDVAIFVFDVSSESDVSYSKELIIDFLTSRDDISSSIICFLNKSDLKSETQEIKNAILNLGIPECTLYYADLTNRNSFSLEKHLEIAAQDVRSSADALGKLTGKVNVEEVLDRIFSNFCIGK